MQASKRFLANVKKLYPQALAAFAVWIITLENGITISWTSPYIAKLTTANSELPLTLDEASWVAALLNLGRLIGAIVGSFWVHFYGSKNACLVTAIPMTIGWILTYSADTPEWLYAARISLGIGFGFSYSCYSLFLGEVASPEIRGSLVSFAMTGGSFGNLLASVTGAQFNLQVTSTMYLVLCVIVLALLSWLPDTPHYLIKVERTEDAKKSMKWYRAASQDYEKELDDVTTFVKSMAVSTFRERFAEFRHSHIRKATLLVMMLFIFMQLSGLNNVLFYMQSILISAGFNLIEPSSMVSYALAGSIVAGILSVRLYDIYGRRALLIVSSAGVSLALTALGTHFVLMNNEVQWFGVQWLPVVSIVVFITSFVVGLNSIPSIVASEVYPANVKPIAMCMASLTAAGAAFAAAKAYQPLVSCLGEAYVFYGHAAITIMAVPFALIFLPETKGKSLQQIQDLLIRKS